MTTPQTEGVITPERFAKGRTFEEYLTYLGSPANLDRESSSGGARRDFSDFLRKQYEGARLDEAQTAAFQWIAAQPGAPRKLLVIAEDWSSDCRRDIPTFARIAEVAGLELRFFDRDGAKTSHMRPDHAQDPDGNADLMAPFLNRKEGEAYQSIPVAVFLTGEFRYVYHYTEYPKVYEKDLLLSRMRAARPGESEEQALERFPKDFADLQASPFFRVWACAAADEIISELHRRFAYV